MYTRCPKCETVFHITMEQLQAHNGTVRCGRCDNVFNADQQLFSDIPENAKEEPAPPPKKTRTASASKTKTGKTKTTRAVKPVAAPAPPPAAPENIADEEVDAAPAPWAAPLPDRPNPIAEPKARRAAAGLLLSPSSTTPRKFSALWIAGIVVLVVMLAAQLVYFYRNPLAAHAALRPYLLELCAQLGCHVQPPYDVSRIELIQPTNIAPHPRIANALRLRATLVNRAAKAQPHPYMQVSLTDNAGRVLARRVFSPQQYLEQPTAGDDMLPHLAVSALIDLTNPDEKTVGYQIDFLAPPPSS